MNYYFTFLTWTVWPHALQHTRLPCPSPSPGVCSDSCRYVAKLCLTLSPWTAACQAFLSFTISQSLLKLMSTESVVPSNHLVFCCPFSSSFYLPKHQGLFHRVSSSHQVAKILELQLHYQSLQWIFRTDFLYDWLVWSRCSPRDSQESFPTPQFKSSNSLVLSFFYSQLSHPYMTIGKTIALTRWIFVNKARSLLFNIMLT